LNYNINITKTLINSFNNYTTQHHPAVLSLIRFSDVIFCVESDLRIFLSGQDSEIFQLKSAKKTHFLNIFEVMLHHEVNFFPKRVMVSGSTTLFLQNPFLIVRISFFFSEKSSN